MGDTLLFCCEVQKPGQPSQPGTHQRCPVFTHPSMIISPSKHPFHLINIKHQSPKLPWLALATLYCISGWMISPYSLQDSYSYYLVLYSKPSISSLRILKMILGIETSFGFFNKDLFSVQGQLRRRRTLRLYPPKISQYRPVPRGTVCT